jgi:hypothetical protein
MHKAWEDHSQNLFQCSRVLEGIQDLSHPTMVVPTFQNLKSLTPRSCHSLPHQLESNKTSGCIFPSHFEIPHVTDHDHRNAGIVFRHQHQLSANQLALNMEDQTRISIYARMQRISVADLAKVLLHVFILHSPLPLCMQTRYLPARSTLVAGYMANVLPRSYW